ncbi:hypothetical protein [Clostridium perfringens]|uniref:hypothetical protein n=2 Tax=Clostridium perfringens TaxID=1502 RepID=UPI00244CC61E|nr:hypothetical protein [Clostridium perfringens]MDH2475893.1 hypothetical protein [Clostridium perfringens]
MKNQIIQLIDSLSNEELIEIYSYSITSLKNRNIIRTKNVVGELGEYIAINHYISTPNLPKLQAAPTGTQNIDAISINGDRYSIKSTTTNTTGVFYGLNNPNTSFEEVQKFEYVIIVKFDNNLNLKAIYELDWKNFLRHKKWHSRMNAWNLTLTKSLIADSKIIFSSIE